ncbi:MAG TPA: glycosyltransferase [Acidimicrobiales bacterium]
MSTAEVDVILVHRDQPERCVLAARAFQAQVGVRTRLTVVDNGSPAPARERLAAALPGVAMVALGRNAGFGPGANAGLRAWLTDGAGDWAVVAPHDALPEPDCLRRLLAAVAERPRAGLVSAEYGEANRPVIDAYLGGMLVPMPRRDGWVATEHPHGTLLACARACLEDIGLFDERYFAYVEEADLGLRAAARGWEVGMVVGALVVNPVTSSPPAVVDYLQLRNTLLLIRDHFGRYPATMRGLIAVVSVVHQSLRPSARAPWFSPRARLRAVADFARGRFGPPPAALG